MSYLFLKNLHIFCVAASFALFFVRGLWVIRAYPPAPEPWIKALPHVVDGLLLLSAAGMVFTAQRFDWSSWMQVKLSLIVVYLVVAVLVFRSGSARAIKALGWIGGLLLFLFITTVAVLRQPSGVFSLL